MANRRRRRQEDSGISGVLYVLLVLVLLVGIGCLFYYSRSQSKECQEYIRELESKEAETKMFVTQVEETEEEAETETETESETDTELESETESVSEAETETRVDTERVSEAEAESGAESEGLSEGEAGSEAGADAHTAESNAEKKAMAEADTQAEAGEETFNIMILNGTGKSGVAAYWKRILGAKGYTHIVMADYKGAVDAQTVVYLKNGGDAPEAFYSCFSTMEVQDGEFALSDNVKIAADQDEYDSYDAWIVVGKDDALHD